MQIRSGLADWLQTGSRTYHPYYLGLLTDALLTVDPAEAQRSVDQALDAVKATGERLSEPELHRLRGHCVLRQGSSLNPMEAENAFVRAIDLARLQGAKSLELLATVDLVNLTHTRGSTRYDAQLSIMLESMPPAESSPLNEQGKSLLMLKEMPR
jgi:predicted ATPase